MGRKYKTPPLIEAVCEFRLTRDTSWDLTIPGLFYEKVKGTFPQREQRVIQEIERSQGPQGLQLEIRPSERIVLFTEDRKRLIQLGPRLLTVNVLRPYPTWQGFKPQIEMAWENLKEILQIEGLERIGLRYINRVELHSSEVKLLEYFEFYPFVGPRLPQNVASFIVGGEFPFVEGRDRCRVQITPVPASSEGMSAFILDIDYFLAQPRAVKVSDIIDWVEEAHSRIEEVFEGCITDRLRELFQEVM
ncbi:TIGR04255 family protein [Candidatus Methylacidiphilum infernorum]|uniref:TIGR04255 family protein n=1 Tax=Candidatus Methylacidiphilum infernorum TaxID=511746 RepID=A0ABX7PXD1_9BACT|nr:TIGR04255 family protein [Candidatus Methylacidiphilum infernorum]QSR87649.1 TIGR04255 family protein [Candidatus Methylacidiphilum infernorum]